LESQRRSQLQVQIVELAELLDAAGFRQPYDGTDKSEAHRLVQLLWEAPDRASAMKLMLQEPAAARSLAVELHAFATALENVLDLRPRVVRDISSVSPYWIALSALLDWTSP
jgi:hypothetical protein